MGIRLGDNQYGKAEVRLVHVNRDTDVHRIKDVNVTSQLRGELETVHTLGDNSTCLPTDTQKNTVYAKAREWGGVGAVEDFALRLARHFVDEHEYVHGARQEVQEYSWERIRTSSGPHDHAFSRRGAETRTAVVTKTGGREWVVSGFEGLSVLKSTGSEFHGFPKTKYTTLPETTDRILATDVTARWRYVGVEHDFDSAYASVRALCLDAFARTHSLALQQTLYEMGRAVLEAHPEIAEIRFSMPNNHHFLVDLSPFGLDNPNEVFFAADRPYGKIEATVERDDAPEPGDAWKTVPGFV
ncbi:factor-independent urate hydroxylase [Nocardiopsis sp. HUAS JQ3]|uniref:factor-independent urate hydroxylase n=1 Tax=Nocardiopsis sp. HUAS JQ3 TaxID=3061629 RepID=UPI0023A9EEA9|nr:urate oxidase [Nocardiopsis sp. HUAS JQ3]WDZ93843.1 urate oxidase [Nocardiopsis sp. HUAS JQ3]